VMRDAVVSKCGHSFSQSSLAQWLETHSTCPVCKQECRMQDNTPNYALRHAIEQYVSSTSPLPGPPPPPPLPDRGSSLSRINISAIINPNNDAFTSQIKEIRPEHVDRVSVVLEQAFRDCTYTRYFYPDGTDHRMQAMVWFYSKIATYAAQNGRVWAAYDNKNPDVLQGVALWQPPYESGISFWDMIKAGMASAPWTMGVKASWRAVSCLDQCEKKHRQTITGPHWALYSIGVDPAFQNLCIGTKLMKPILDCADADQLPCYLDTPSERSLNFFRRLGFEVVLDVDSPPAGPPFWTMVRQPQVIHRK